MDTIRVRPSDSAGTPIPPSHPMSTLDTRVADRLAAETLAIREPGNMTRSVA